MWKSDFLLRGATKNYTQAIVEKEKFLTEHVDKNQTLPFSTIYLFTIHNLCGLKLKTGIDIGCNVTHAVLHGGITGFQRGFHFTDRVEDCGMILGKFIANVGQAEIGQFADQIHGHLACLGNTAVALGSA